MHAKYEAYLPTVFRALIRRSFIRSLARPSFIILPRLPSADSRLDGFFPHRFDYLLTKIPFLVRITF